MTLKLQSCLLSNVSCYYERKSEMKNARLYYEHAIQLWQRAHEQGQTLTAAADATGEDPTS